MNVKEKRTICRILCLTLFLLTLGIVGGMEWGDIPVRTGAVLAVLSEAVGAFLLWKGGVIKVR